MNYVMPLLVCTFTGCDSVSAFAGKGKSRSIKLLLSSEKYIDLFKGFGKEYLVTNDERKLLEAFTCEIYRQKKGSINDARYSLYCCRNGKIVSEQLPPCSNSLYHHSKRACYQTKIWRSSFIVDYVLPMPQNGYDWELKDDILSVVWFSCKPAPQQCMDLLSCSCKKECVPTSCCCIDDNLSCTDMCTIECDNKVISVLQAYDNLSDEEDELISE